MIVYRISNYCDYNGGRVLDIITEGGKVTAFDYYKTNESNDWDILDPTIGESIKSYVRRCMELTEGDFGHAEPITLVKHDQATRTRKAWERLADIEIRRRRKRKKK
tara:strand:- start:178 stop:495 length:318 start_codon:yes stop_codon:yes gene_type:complete